MSPESEVEPVKSVSENYLNSIYFIHYFEFKLLAQNLASETPRHDIMCKHFVSRRYRVSQDGFNILHTMEIFVCISHTI